MCRGYVEVSTVQQYVVLVEKNCIGNYVRLMQKNVGSYVYASLLTRQGTAVYPKGQPNTDQSRSKVGADHPCYRGEVAQQLFKIEIIMRPG